ncbi:2114_t:CDS:1 [Dentiscutata erythropus]|uniref:2114_t:CDS:1 n=1 Tax=Dentiscutata erythropus TaxID=1348616 RepID=A0A9N9JM25_9GLOM|nr:2114_t:CDS:1 [Dentiscutata erythropus]
MLSKLLHDLGFGYYLDSVEIKISPIPHENDDSISQMIVPKGDYKQPQQLNRPIEIISDHEISKGVEGQVNGAGVQIKGSYDAKNANSAKKITYEWEAERDGCGTTGVCWLYRPVNNKKCLLFRVFTLVIGTL